MNERKTIEMQGQAEHWFARMLASDCTSAERVACQRWRAQAESHESAYREVESFWLRSMELRDSPAMVDAYQAIEHHCAGQRTRRPRYWLPMVGTLAVALAVSVLALKLRQAVPVQELHYRTAVGEQHTVELPDGSTLVLDTDTSLVARYSRAERSIDMENGQASFSVAHDGTRPFSVRAAGGSVTALGTRFQVRAEASNGRATVTLLEGAVRVDGPRTAARGVTTATLAPGDQLQFDRAGMQWATRSVDLDSASAWTRGNVRIRDGRLADLLAELNRYSIVQLRLVEPELAELRISGTFRPGDATSLARLLEHSWSVRAMPGGENEILLTSK